MNTPQPSSAHSRAPIGTAGSVPEVGHSLLRMAVGPEVLAVPIEAVREILQVTRMTPLPRTPEFVRGVMNLRGSVVPVIDLSARLGFDATTIGRRSCIVVVECTSVPEEEDCEPTTLVVGLLVDAVFEVFDTLPGEIEAVPAMGTRAPAASMLGMTRARGQVIGVLAIDHILDTKQLARDIELGSHSPRVLSA
jgi:purine-binding chemotaxis protein CheW